MIRRKWISTVTAGLVGLVVVITMIFMMFPADAIAVGNHFDYETLLFDADQIMQVEITVDPEEWNQMLENALAEEYISCDVTINGKTISSVGIRPKGNTSLSQVANSDSDRYSFKIEFDHYIAGQSCYGLDKLVLNNMISDNTYMKEYFAYDLLSFMEIPASLYSYAKISVNGEDWGLYLALEAMEESFLQRNYGSDYGMLYKPESDSVAGGGMQGDENREMNPPEGENGRFSPPEQGGEMPFAADSSQGEIMPNQSDNGGGQQFSGKGGFGMDGSGSGADLVYTDDEIDSYASIFDNEVTDGTKTDYKRLIRSLKQLSESDELEEVVDVDEVLRYFAVNTVLVNLDSYVSNMKHNYYLYEKNGQLQMLPWDYNLAFAGFQSASASAAVNFPIDTPVSGTTMEATPMLSKLLEVEEYKEKYYDYLRQIVEEYFNSSRFTVTLSKLHLLIDDKVANDPTAFCTYEEYQQAAEMLKEFALLRIQSIEGQLNGEIPSTESGQQENPDLLIDSSDINLQTMGMQGGDHQRGKGEERNQATKTTEGERPVMAEFGTGEVLQENRKTEDFIGGRNMMGQTAAAKTTAQNRGGQLIEIGIGGILLLGSLVFVICFPKRKWLSHRKKER